MSDESKITKEDILEQMQAGHRARLDGSILQNLGNKDAVQFREVMPNRPQQQPQTAQAPQQQGIPASYLNYAEQLLEQMRGVYASSWDNCGCGGNSWHGGHNHFYDPCSGADAAPPSSSCPNFDCTSNTCCNDNFVPPRPKPQPFCPPPMPDCGCGTTTYYDDCAYKLQQLCDQLNRIENMTKEMYMTNQQLFSYVIEYYNNFIANTNTSASSTSDC